MDTNDVLKIKYETQKRLDEEAQHNIRKYTEISHKNVQKIWLNYGVKFKYGTPKNVGTTCDEGVA